MCMLWFALFSLCSLYARLVVFKQTNKTNKTTNCLSSCVVLLVVFVYLDMQLLGKGTPVEVKLQTPARNTWELLLLLLLIIIITNSVMLL